MTKIRIREAGLLGGKASISGYRPMMTATVSLDDLAVTLKGVTLGYSDRAGFFAQPPLIRGTANSKSENSIHWDRDGAFALAVRDKMVQVYRTLAPEPEAPRYSFVEQPAGFASDAPGTADEQMSAAFRVMDAMGGQHVD